MFTVWQVTSPSCGETRRIVRAMHPDDWRYVHDYQSIVWQGDARSKADALRLAVAS